MTKYQQGLSWYLKSLACPPDNPTNLKEYQRASGSSKNEKKNTIILYLRATRLDGNPVLTHHQREHDEGDELRCVGFGGCHSDFGSGVDVDAAVRFTADGRSHCVCHTNDQSTALLAVAQGQQCVGGFTCSYHIHHSLFSAINMINGLISGSSLTDQWTN